MDGATLQGKIYAGRARAAAKIGLSYNQFRPLVAAAPLANQVGTLLAAFNAGDSNYRKPNLPGDPIWFGDFDGRVTQAGDYLVRVSGGQIYYIAGQQQLLPIVCVDCNRSVKITRPVPVTAVGAVGYGGMQAAQETVVLGATALWPASILLGGRSQVASTLPAAVKDVGWKIMLPLSVPITIGAGDIVVDDLGRRYAVEGAEITDLGWRINSQEIHA